MLCYVMLCYILFYAFLLYCIVLYYIVLYIKLYYIILYYILFYSILFVSIISYFIILWYDIILYYIILYYIILYHIILYYIISYYIILNHKILWFFCLHYNNLTWTFYMGPLMWQSPAHNSVDLIQIVAGHQKHRTLQSDRERGRGNSFKKNKQTGQASATTWDIQGSLLQRHSANSVWVRWLLSSQRLWERLRCGIATFPEVWGVPKVVCVHLRSQECRWTQNRTSRCWDQGNGSTD